MPRYVYKCTNCEHIFEVVHSIKIKLKKCEKCEINDSLQRLPSTFIHGRPVSSPPENNKAGNVVKSKIEEFKKDLNKMKKESKEQEYKPDD